MLALTVTTPKINERNGFMILSSLLDNTGGGGVKGENDFNIHIWYILFTYIFFVFFKTLPLMQKNPAAIS
jgi:hypothetical protein